MKKRILVVMLGAALALSMTACGNKTEEAASASENTAQETEEGTEEAEAEEVDETAEEVEETEEAAETEEAELAEADTDVEGETLSEDEIDEEEDESEETPESEILEYIYDEDLDELIKSNASDSEIAEYIDGMNFDTAAIDKGQGIKDIADIDDDEYDRYSYSFYFDSEDGLNITNLEEVDKTVKFSVSDKQIKYDGGAITIKDGIASTSYDGVTLYFTVY